MSRIFSRCGHPFTTDNCVKDGGGRLRCKTCRHNYFIRIGKVKEPKAPAPPPPPRCCRECDKVLSGANTTGLCFSCYNRGSAAYLNATRDNNGLPSDIEVAVELLAKAIRREHPAIVDHLLRRQSERRAA